jgi:hypothetical protein
MHTLNEQDFDLGIFMKRRGWNSVIAIALLAVLIILIELKTPA